MQRVLITSGLIGHFLSSLWTSCDALIVENEKAVYSITGMARQQRDGRTFRIVVKIIQEGTSAGGLTAQLRP